LQADKEHIDVASPTETHASKKESGCMQAVWSRLFPIPDACQELVTCGCKLKCKTAGCSCFWKNLKCTSACGCEAIHCCNSAGQQSHITCIWDYNMPLLVLLQSIPLPLQRVVVSCIQDDHWAISFQFMQII